MRAKLDESGYELGFVAKVGNGNVATIRKHRCADDERVALRVRVHGISTGGDEFLIMIGCGRAPPAGVAEV